MAHEEEAVVIPLVPMTTEPSTDAMLRMLLNREAIVLSRVSAPLANSPSGMVAPTAGAFAKAIAQAAQHVDRTPAPEGLYRVILPSGSVAKDLVPAVGGGYRGMVRAGGAPAIAGHVRLVPAVAATGATIAAGPLIATVGLAVASEMLAQHQMNKKLTAIKSVVLEVQGHLEAEDRAILATARQEASKVAGYLLDQASLPYFAGASHAFGQLAQLTNKHVERLDRWLEVAASHSSDSHVPGGRLLNELIGKRDNQIDAFQQAVAQTYETLALRARIVVLEKIAAELSSPGRSLPHVEHALRTELRGLSERQGQLVALMDDLNALQIQGGRLPNPAAVNRAFSARTSFGRLARALHAAPDSLPLLTESDQTMLELAPTPRGLSVIAPAVA